MKKERFLFTAVLIVMAVLCVFLQLSCKSAQPVTDDCFNDVYKKYKNDLILDGAKSYTVGKGDMLYDISRVYYDNYGFYYPVIMLASSEIVKDPDKIKPGMVLTIPDLKANLNNEKARIAIKGVILDCADLEERRNRNKAAKEMRNHASLL